MRKKENLIRSCETCEYCELGCEEKCPFELPEEVGRQTLAKRRKNMKAEKANAYEKAMCKLNSAENKAAVETSYEKSNKKRIKNLESELEQLIEVHEDKKYELCKSYPKAVFDARVNAIKQAERKLRRQQKNKK